MIGDRVQAMGMNSKRLWATSWLFKIVPTSRGHRLKTRLLRWAGAEVGDNCEIMSITIEDSAKVGIRTVLTTGTHRFSQDGNCIEKEGTHADVRVCAGAAVSTGSTVLPGITVNRMSHVAAETVVTRDVPEFHRVAGVPARVVRDSRSDRRIQKASDEGVAGCESPI